MEVADKCIVAMEKFEQAHRPELKSSERGCKYDEIIADAWWHQIYQPINHT